MILFAWKEHIVQIDISIHLYGMVPLTEDTQHTHTRSQFETSVYTVNKTCVYTVAKSVKTHLSTRLPAEKYPGLHRYPSETNGGICCIKDKLTEKHGGSTLCFQISASQSLIHVKSCDTDQTAHRQAQNHKIEFITRVLASMPDH